MIKISIRQLRALLGVLALLGALAAKEAAAAPLMTYQGRLKESGLPVSGTKSIDILLCNCLSGTCAPACSPSGAQNVAVSSGLFRTTFTVPSNVDLAAGAWYLEVQVGGTPLSPREQLTSSPYAVVASSASGLAAAPGSPGVSVSTPVYFTGLPSASTQELFRLTKTTFGGSIFKQYYDPSSAYGLQIVGTEAQVVLVTDTGASPPRVGIGGVLLPKTSLDVSGDAQFGTGAAKSTFTTTGNLQLVSGSTITSNGTFSISTAASAALTGVPAIFINRSGQVGIGTNAPAEALHVYSTTANGAHIRVEGSGASANPNITIKAVSGGGEASLTLDRADTGAPSSLDFYTAGVADWYVRTPASASGQLNFLKNDAVTSVMTLLQGGNVGINSTSPSLNLSLGNTAPRTFGVEDTGGITAPGNTLTIQSGGGGTLATGGFGGSLILKGGAAGGTASNPGGSVILTPGDKTNAGIAGAVEIAGGSGGAHLRATQTNAPGFGGFGICGTGPTMNIGAGSTDMHGSIVIITGTGPTGVCGANIGFNRSYAVAPKAILLSPGSQGAANPGVNGLLYVSALSASGFTVTTAVAPAVSTNLTWYYVVIE